MTDSIKNEKNVLSCQTKLLSPIMGSSTRQILVQNITVAAILKKPQKSKPKIKPIQTLTQPLCVQRSSSYISEKNVSVT